MCLRYDNDDDDERVQESSCDIAKEWSVCVLGSCSCLFIVYLCLWIINTE
jgi:hypothetical protein